MSDRPRGEPPEPDEPDEPVVPEEEGEGEGEEEEARRPHVPDQRDMPGGQPPPG